MTRADSTQRLMSRLTAPIAAVATLALGIAIMSAWYVRNMQKSIARVLANNVVSVRAAQELEISIREVRTQFDRYLITQDEIHLKSIPALKLRTAQALQEAESTATTQIEHVHMRRVRQGYERFFSEYDIILKNRDQWKYSKIIELIDQVLSKEILEPAHEYLRINEGVLDKVATENRDSVDHITLALIVLGFCGAFGGILTGTILAWRIRRSIMHTEAQVRQTTEELVQAIQSERSILPNTTDDPVEQMTLTAIAVLKRLRQTERDALRAEQLAWVGQMAAGIAHEIRNPLMAMKLIVQAATTPTSDRKLRPRDLQVIEEEIRRVERIVNQFMDFARPHRVDAQQVDIVDLVSKCIETIRGRAIQQQVQIELRATPDSLMVAVDPNQIHQVVFNLIVNALDAQPTGGFISINIDMATHQGQEGDLVLNVTDGGPGIHEAIREQLFQPFTSTKESGMGLGLSICRRIVEAHNGTITVTTSTLGTRFTLTIPMPKPTAPILAPPMRPNAFSLTSE